MIYSETQVISTFAFRAIYGTGEKVKLGVQILIIYTRARGVSLAAVKRVGYTTESLVLVHFALQLLLQV